MRTRYSEDQQAVREVFGDLFSREATLEAVRAAEEGCGFDPALWDKLGAAGAPGMALAEESGGGGASLADFAVVVYEWGRRIAPVPLVEHAVTTRLLASLAEGTASSRSTPEPGFNAQPPAPSPSTQAEGAGTSNETLDSLVEAAAAGDSIATLTLRPVEADGTARLVPAGAVADIVVALRGDSLVVDRGDPPRVCRANTAHLPLADRELSEAATVLAGPAAWVAWERALAEWKSLMAVAHAGLAQEALDMGVAYVKQRHQFGVPVGSFQAVQHGLADAAVRVEGARLLAFRAVCALDTAHLNASQQDARRLAAMALLFAADSARFATDRVLHYHGGYGYSAEYDVQLYYRRAASWLLQLGEPASEIARLAASEFAPAPLAA